MTQNYVKKNRRIKSKFLELKEKDPRRFEKRLNLSWSNWTFGLESIEDSALRLKEAGLKYIEIHGNNYGADLGYEPKRIKNILSEYGLEVSGVCGMFSVNNDMSSNNPFQRQEAIDYLKRQIELTKALDGDYLLVVPGAVGRPNPYDEAEFERSVNTFNIIRELFNKNGIKPAIEPVRSEEVSIIHTIKEAKEYINACDYTSSTYINGDVFHMQTEENHIGEAILEANELLTNLHFADSNRSTLGSGSLDLDTIIMALYLINYNRDGCYVTFEPLGPGGDVYKAMNYKPNKKILDNLVQKSIAYFKKREEKLLN